MRKYLLLLLLIVYVNYAYTQVENIPDQTPKIKKSSNSRFLIKAYGGFGFFSPGSYRIVSINNISFQSSPNSYYDTLVQTQGRKGIGGGRRYGGGIGYILNDFWSIGVDFEFQKGQKLTNALGTKLSEYNYDSTSDEMHYKAMAITPYITFKAVSKPDYFLYNRMGILFTLPFTLHKTGNSATSRGSLWPPGPSDSSMFPGLSLSRQDRTDDYKLSLGIGFNLAFGINWRLTSHLRIFGELFGNFSALHPKSSVSIKDNHSSFSYYSAVYDFSVYPAVVIRYESFTNGGKYYERNDIKYQNGGSIESKQDSYNMTPSGDVYVGNSSRDQRFHINMNSIGLNCGIQLRL